MLLLFSGEGSQDLGQNIYGHNGLCAPGQWAPGPMAYLAGELFRHLHPTERSFLDEAYFISRKDLITLSGEFDRPQLRGTGLSKYHSKMARTLGFVALCLAAKTELAVIPIFFRDYGRSRSSEPKDYKKVFESIVGEKQGFRQFNIKSGVAMLPCPISEVWLLCALKNNYKACDELENESPHGTNEPDRLKKMLARCLEARAFEISDLPELIQNKTIDHSRIKMPSYDGFSDSLKTAVEICQRGDWRGELPGSLRRYCGEAIKRHKSWFE